MILQTIGFISVLFVVSVLQIYIAESKEGRMVLSRTSSLAVPGGEWTVDSILENPETARLFELHLVREFGIESLLFIRAIDEWNANFSKSSSGRVLQKLCRIS